MPPTAFDPNRYPRTYRHWIVYRVVVSLFGALIGVSGIAALFALIAGQPSRPSDAPPISWGMSLVIAIGAIVIIVLTWRHRVLLTGTFVELRGFRTRRIPRSDITGYRRRVGPRGIIVYMIDVKGRPRPVPIRCLDEDDDFKAWFAGLDNADGKDLRDALLEIAADKTLGPTPKSRLQAATSARGWGMRLGFAALALCIWTSLYPEPRPLPLLLSVAAPLIALAICGFSDGRFILSATRNSGRGDLSYIIVFSLIALGFRTARDDTFATPSVLLVPAIAAGGVLAALAFGACRDLRKHRVLALFNVLFYALYAAAALHQMNCEFDRTAGASQLATIVGVRRVTGKYAASYFTLSQVFPDMRSREVEVSPRVFARHSPDGQICLIEREGAFGWHWIQSAEDFACQAHDGRTAHP